MDERKDIQKIEYFSKILDGYTVRTNPFGRNVSGDRAYRRAERLSAAIHMLTAHVPSHEPARRKIRAASIELLSAILSLRDEMRVSVSPAYRAVQVLVRELTSLVKVLAVSGFVSSSNANIVTEALDEIGNFLSVSQRSVLSESMVFTKEDLLGQTDIPSLVAGDLSFTSDVQKNTRTNVITKRTNSISKDISRTKNQVVKNTSTEVRANAVLSILKTQGVLGIKDIASNLPEYSEKMIQRELAVLVADGRVRKTGLKRWSRYEFLK